MQSIFITGIGTDTGKTVVAAIITEALQAAYWKPVQAGFDQRYRQRMGGLPDQPAGRPDPAGSIPSLPPRLSAYCCP